MSVHAKHRSWYSFKQRTTTCMHWLWLTITRTSNKKDFIHSERLGMEVVNRVHMQLRISLELAPYIVTQPSLHGYVWQCIGCYIAVMKFVLVYVLCLPLPSICTSFWFLWKLLKQVVKKNSLKAESCRDGSGKQSGQTSKDIITALLPYTVPHNHPYISSCKPGLLRYLLQLLM